MVIIVDSAVPFMEGRLPGEVELKPLPGDKITPEAIHDADALIVRTRTRCDRQLLEGSKVRLVATATIGTDHIDIHWCESNGVRVCNAPGCNAPGVAQYVWSALLRSGFNPKKHTLGIVGYGHVGQIVAQWGRQMGVRLLINDPPRQASGLQDADYLPLREVLQNSDAVTLHVPLDETTRGLISAEELSLMKPGAILVNTSRGGIVKESDLKPLLKSGSLKAIVDVWENEPDYDRELAGMALFATPHIAGYSAEGKKRATAMSLRALSQELGIPVNLSGLECIPSIDGPIKPSIILDSYDPSLDSLTQTPTKNQFETLRNNYNYRHEPFFS
ncbi:MAG: 4-phosphoerythronate dehydrogenase [Muribaculaceae bacterium]|nr:4-phosphoerythronate dehydrogenase [Muribaculaceae bacterium]